MKDKLTLGKRIRYFRTRAKLSQSQLEVEADLPFGTISRIENNSINPLKETINKIAETLDLNSIELDYLIGSSIYPASQEELTKAQKEINSYFRKRFTIAYLIDDRFRFVDISEDFYKFLNLSDEDRKNMIGRSMVSVCLDEKVGILKRLANPEATMRHLFERFHGEMGFMVDDPYYQDAIETINRAEFSKRIWEEVQSKPPLNLLVREMRRVDFKILGFTIPLYYANEYLKQDRRFQIVEYQPTGKLLKFLKKKI